MELEHLCRYGRRPVAAQYVDRYKSPANAPKRLLLHLMKTFLSLGHSTDDFLLFSGDVEKRNACYFVTQHSFPFNYWNIQNIQKKYICRERESSGVRRVWPGKKASKYLETKERTENK